MNGKVGLEDVDVDKVGTRVGHLPGVQTAQERPCMELLAS